MKDIDTLLREADPAAHTPDYTEAERRDLLAAALTSPPRRRSRLLPRLAAVAAATALVAWVGVSQLAGSGATARAEEVLTEAAINAVDEPARPDQYWEITQEGSAGDPACPESSIERRYIAVDGNRPSWYYLKDTSPNCHPDTPNPDESGWQWAKSPNEMVDSWTYPSPKFLASLPRDPIALRDKMAADSRKMNFMEEALDAGHGPYMIISRLLSSDAVPADLRVAFFEVLKMTPGLDITQELERDGRAVVILEVPDGEGTGQLMLDPETGQSVGYYYQWGEDNVREGTFSRKLVDEIPPEVVAVSEASGCIVVDDYSMGDPIRCGLEGEPSEPQSPSPSPLVSPSPSPSR